MLTRSSMVSAASGPPVHPEFEASQIPTAATGSGPREPFRLSGIWCSSSSRYRHSEFAVPFHRIVDMAHQNAHAPPCLYEMLSPSPEIPPSLQLAADQSKA